MGVISKMILIPSKAAKQFVLDLYACMYLQSQFLSTNSAGKFRSKKPPPTPAFLARFREEHPLSSELPDPEGRSSSAVTPTLAAYIQESFSLTFLMSIQSQTEENIYKNIHIHNIIQLES